MDRQARLIIYVETRDPRGGVRRCTGRNTNQDHLAGEPRSATPPAPIPRPKTMLDPLGAQQHTPSRPNKDQQPVDRTGLDNHLLRWSGPRVPGGLVVGPGHGSQVRVCQNRPRRVLTTAVPVAAREAQYPPEWPS